MGIFDQLKGNGMGTKAYRMHVSATQLKKSGKYEEAEAKFTEALKLYDQAYADGFRKPTALNGYAILLMQRGQFERAREVMLENSKDKAMPQEDRFELRINYSIYQWKVGKLDKAIETINSAAMIKKNGTIYTTLGMYLVEKARETGAFEEALRFNQEAVDYDDEDAGTIDNCGQLYLAMSDHARAAGDAGAASEYRKKALEFFKRAHELKPTQLTTLYYLAKLDHEDGDDLGARALIDKALQLPCSLVCSVSVEEMKALSGQIGKA